MVAVLATAVLGEFTNSASVFQAGCAHHAVMMPGRRARPGCPLVAIKKLGSEPLRLCEAIFPRGFYV